MKHYKQLTYEQRCQIEVLKKSGFTQSEIAAAVGVSQSTISRELTRNIGLRGYRHKQAQRAAINLTTRRGFTGHEHLDRIGLIHMNGRVYDPILGRFISPDPLVQAPTNSQNWNRYSYVFNNPLSFTDPSGYVTVTTTVTTCSGQVRSDGSTYGEDCESKPVVDYLTDFEVCAASRDPYSCALVHAGNKQDEIVTERVRAEAAHYAQEGQYGDCNGCVNPSWGPTDVVLGLYGVGSALANGLRALTVAGVTKLLTMRNGFTVDPKKFNYFFGRVTSGNAHNIQRSAQNAKDLATLGITSERQLMGVFRNAFKNGLTVSTRSNNYGVSVTRSIAVGEQGAVNVSFFYSGGNMGVTPSVTTLIPKIYN